MSMAAELIAIRRPLLMRVTGRSGLAPIVLFALVLGAVIGLGRGGPPPIWFVALGMGYVLVDCWGGLAVTSDSVQFRSVLLMKKIPLSKVDAVAVVRGVGYWGAGSVPALKLRDGTRVRLTPMASLSRAQVRAAAEEIANAVGVRLQR